MDSVHPGTAEDFRPRRGAEIPPVPLRPRLQPQRAVVNAQGVKAPQVLPGAHCSATTAKKRRSSPPSGLSFIRLWAWPLGQ